VAIQSDALCGVVIAVAGLPRQAEAFLAMTKAGWMGRSGGGSKKHPNVPLSGGVEEVFAAKQAPGDDDEGGERDAEYHA
jgi:hypothetical protein